MTRRLRSATRRLCEARSGANTAISGYLLFDARATFRIDKTWSVATGINNIGNYQQWDYFAELQYDF